MNRVEVREYQNAENVVYRYALDTIISYKDIKNVVTSLPEQHKYSFCFKNKEEILNFYKNPPELYEAEYLVITEEFDGKSIGYRFDLNTNDCTISMPLGSPEYVETLELIEKIVLENKKRM